jgi:hypothetical protein
MIAPVMALRAFAKSRLSGIQAAKKLKRTPGGPYQGWGCAVTNQAILAPVM